MGSGLLLTELSFPGGSERTHFRSECPHLSPKVLRVFITVYLISLLVVAIKREFSFFSSPVFCNSCSSVVVLTSLVRCLLPNH